MALSIRESHETSSVKFPDVSQGASGDTMYQRKKSVVPPDRIAGNCVLGKGSRLSYSAVKLYKIAITSPLGLRLESYYSRNAGYFALRYKIALFGEQWYDAYCNSKKYLLMPDVSFSRSHFIISKVWCMTRIGVKLFDSG